MQKLFKTAALLVAIFSTAAIAPASTIKATQLFSFGSSGSGDGQFDFPEAMAINPTTGLIYVSDSNNNRIQVFTANGTFLGKWGTFGVGNGQLKSPGCLAINESTGDVYVADYGNNRIQRFSSLGTYISQWGTMGSGNGQFQSPNGLAIDQSTGNVYVSEFSGNRVQYFNTAGVYIGKWGSSANFASPNAVAIEASTGSVFVTNYNGANIQRFSATGTAETSWSTKGSTPFSQPSGVAILSDGHVVVPDRTTPIPIFTRNGTLLAGFGTSGTGTTQYQSSFGAAAGANGLALVSDSSLNHVIAWRISTVNLPPTVTITGKARIKTSRPRLTLHGTATDPDGTITGVLVKVGKKSAAAAGTTSWTSKVRLRPGRNRISVTATDSDGGTSAAAHIVVIRK